MDATLYSERIRVRAQLNVWVVQLAQSILFLVLRDSIPVGAGNVICAKNCFIPDILLALGALKIVEVKFGPVVVRHDGLFS